MRVSDVGGVSQHYRITVIGGGYKVAWRAVLTLHAGCLSGFKAPRLRLPPGGAVRDDGQAPRVGANTPQGGTFPGGN
jgi:hypothetical protein